VTTATAAFRPGFRVTGARDAGAREGRLSFAVRLGVAVGRAPCWRATAVPAAPLASARREIG
jgi:hypothetical protein